MRTIEAIAASAGLLGCAVLYAAADHGVNNRDPEIVVEEARALETELARAFLWLSGAFERCYALSDSLHPTGATIAEQSRMRAIQFDTCSAGTLTPGFE